MADIQELNFELMVTKIFRENIDKLIKLADSDKKENYKKLILSLDDESKGIDTKAFREIYDNAKINFALYALAIVHCYSILENNRRLICQRISGITPGQYNNLHNIEVARQCLERIGITHSRIRCYKTMNEFRMVNNAVKHDRYSLSTQVEIETGKIYRSKQLKSLYNKCKFLESYLTDLYNKTAT